MPNPPAIKPTLNTHTQTHTPAARLLLLAKSHALNLPVLGQTLCHGQLPTATAGCWAGQLLRGEGAQRVAGYGV